MILLHQNIIEKMTTTNAKLATPELQEKRKNYPTYSGEELKRILGPKIDPMPCIKDDEVELETPRLLIVKGGKILDVTDSLNQRAVEPDEVYYVGWTK